MDRSGFQAEHLQLSMKPALEGPDLNPGMPFLQGYVCSEDNIPQFKLRAGKSEKQGF